MKFAVCIRNYHINNRNLQSSVRFVSTSNITLSLSKNVDVDKENDENVKKSTLSIENSKHELFKTTIPIIYTDGCCLNGGRPDAIAGIGVFWGENDERNQSLSIVGLQKSGRAELLAVIRALEQVLLF
jgi:hypothetical protein